LHPDVVIFDKDEPVGMLEIIIHNNEQQKQKESGQMFISAIRSIIIIQFLGSANPK
jgi:hypothetical protein